MLECKSDALNFTIAVDQYMADMWKPLEPHYNIFVANRPGEVSNNIKYPKPVIATMSHWLEVENTQPPSPEKLAAFAAIPEAH